LNAPQAPRRSWRRSWLGLLLPALLAFIVLIGLGTWQVERKAWKEALIAALTERLAVPPRALPASSSLHRCFRGEVWGADMYQALRRAKITLNSHIDMAGREAGNMRLFEATGVGAFLLTDFKDNLHNLFAPEREVVAWRSVDECLAAVDRYLANDDVRSTIAKAGQTRTMAQHTYRHRAAEILALVDGLRTAA